MPAPLRRARGKEVQGMKLPRLSGSQPAGDTLIRFKGYNRTDRAGKDEFHNMENMTGDRFPLLAPRGARGTVRTLTKANGLYARDKLLWVDGTEVFYGEKKIGDVEDSEKQFVSVGAYVLIFPDKVYYNTATDTFGSMENKYISSGTVRYTQSWLTDTELDAEGQIYVKIEAAGIEAGFEKGDGVEISGFTEDKINGTRVIQDIGTGWIKIIAAIDKDGSQSAAVTIRRKLPDMDYYTVAENRLWGCSSRNHEIYASKLGSPFNFYCFEGLASDSYAATIANDGDFTGAVTYLGYVMFFKERSVHKVYGNKPANFQIIEGQLRGVEKGSAESLKILNEVLYYKSPAGVMSFQGSMPYDIGEALGEGYYATGEASAGVIGNKYYISLKDAKGRSHLFVYDATKGLWHREDGTKARYFTAFGGNLYYLEGNTIKTVSYLAASPLGQQAEPAIKKDGEIVEWHAETTDFTYQTAESKFISRIGLRCEVSGGAALEVWIDYDSRGAWERLTSVGETGKNIRNIPIIPRRCDHFRLKFAGYGECVIYDMIFWLTMGSNERRR